MAAFASVGMYISRKETRIKAKVCFREGKTRDQGRSPYSSVHTAPRRPAAAPKGTGPG